MNKYHPDTDREIIRLHNAGHTTDDIADQTGADTDYIATITRYAVANDTTRQQILDMWHDGTGKLEISARLLLPLTAVQAVIKAGSTHYRRPPPQRHPECTHATSRTDRLLALGDQSTRQNTRKLAERARTALDQLRTAVEEERRQKRLAQQVERATRQLEAARQALREKP